MNILFWGQLGLPRLTQRDEASAEVRAAVLARDWAVRGHTVSLIGTYPYVTRRGNDHGITTTYRPSLNPTKPGGFVFQLLGLLHLIRTQPDIVHVQGWTATALLPIAIMLSRTTSFILTIDHLPSRYRRIAKLLIKLLLPHLQALTATTRQVQYSLLQDMGIRSIYVPDGYTEQTATVSLHSLKLRKGQYVLLLGRNMAHLQRVARAYKQAGVRKKLVIPGEITPALRRLYRTYRGVTLVGDLRGKALQAVLEGALFVVAADETVSVTTILHTMNAGRALAAVTTPLYQETAGTTALFFNKLDRPGLLQLLQSLADDEGKRHAIGAKARTRARRHFLWSRIMPEYHALYHGHSFVGSVDSVRKPRFTQLPAA